jgi:signal transduction histidine kinase
VRRASSSPTSTRVGASPRTSCQRVATPQGSPHPGPARNAGVFVVEDEGDGVPPELREAIFEPFRQGPGPSDHAPGVGVGLSLVARFAELHGGAAWVVDRPGGGASSGLLPRLRRPRAARAGRPPV